MTKHVYHTPGPWSVIPGVYDTSPEASEFPHGPEVIAEGRMHIASLNMYAEADAQLIAAAPELLQALRDCQAVLKSNLTKLIKHDDPEVGKQMFVDFLSTVDVAIAKATKVS